MEALVTHLDADGIISASLFLKIKPNVNIYFSSHSLLLKSLCSLLIKDFPQVTILDISPTQKTLFLSSIFDKAIWIDHHVWEKLEIPKNVEIFNENLKSTASLVAKIFEINDEITKIADEIDTNEVKSEEAEFFRDLISTIKWKYKSWQILKFRQIIKFLVYKNIEELIKKEDNVKDVTEFRNWVKEKIEEILDKIIISQVKNKKIILVESYNNVPVYSIFNELKEREKFDILAVFYRKVNYKEKKISTKIEFRTSNNFNVLLIAKYFGGGGHKFASGCFLDYYLTFNDFLERIENLI
ncbi:MAG: DHHA1 domain-containing protein [Candidatus Aenigmatarchaeota archaeon]